MRGQRREGRTPSVEPELRFGSHTAVVFYPLILLKSLVFDPLTSAVQRRWRSPSDRSRAEKHTGTPVLAEVHSGRDSFRLRALSAVSVSTRQRSRGRQANGRRRFLFACTWAGLSRSEPVVATLPSSGRCPARATTLPGLRCERARKKRRSTRKAPITPKSASSVVSAKFHSRAVISRFRCRRSCSRGTQRRFGCGGSTFIGIDVVTVR